MLTKYFFTYQIAGVNREVSNEKLFWKNSRELAGKSLTEKSYQNGRLMYQDKYLNNECHSLI